MAVLKSPQIENIFEKIQVYSNDTLRLLDARPTCYSLTRQYESPKTDSIIFRSIAEKLFIKLKIILSV